jgi:DHA1 family tetracycline resistance protein-like MFS transporter
MSAAGPGSPLPGGRSRRSALTFIFLTILLDTIGLGIVIPVLPELITVLTKVDLSHAALYGGALAFVYAATQFFCAPILGNLSDRFGRRPVLLYSLASFGVDYLLMSMAPNISWLFVGRAVAGMSGASFSAAGAYVADVTPPERRAQSFGMIGAAFGLGFTIGPAIGGLLGGFGPRVPFLFAAGAAFANLALGAVALPESLPRESRRPFSWRRANPLGALLQIRRYPSVLGIAAAVFVWQLAHQALPSTWSYYTILKFSWSERAVGGSLAFIGLVMSTSQGFLTRALIPRLGGERRAALFGFSAAFVGYTVYAFASESWQIYLGMTTWLLGGMTYPSMNALMSRVVDKSAQGELQGAVTSLASLASIVGPLLMTQLFARYSAAGAPVRFPGAPFAASALLAVIGFALLVVATRRALPPGAAG